MKKTRIAIIDKKKCQPKTCNYLCKSLCPGVRMGDDTIVIDENMNLPIIDEVLCTGCGICVNRCPHKAIEIINIGVDMDKVLHQYGKNQFRLFSLPLPEKGYVTGIVGKNGVGKSTAINILSGTLISNFGDYDKKANIDNTIEHFRGKEIQQHFRDLKNKEVNIAYKIQMVEEIPKLFKNKIIDLLKNISNNEDELNNIIKELELEQLINKKPSEISGGELQRVAIAATLLKKADLYFFDEFSTFLDIKQRFKIAKLLSEKITKENAMIVIEHDLAILDYLSDFVQVMFGEKQAYGLSSNKKSTKNGINEFLEGFLKEENTRIRGHKIDFVSTRDKTETEYEKKEILKYPEMEKQLGNFKLKVNQGKVNSSEIIGILGSNAIGKTTFIKLLSGELKADKGEGIDQNSKVAYKPQYIDYEDVLVRDLFREKEVDQDVFNSELKRQFDIEVLFNQKLSEISGGELQKIAIAHTLSKKADIYLLDEPSAFLDVELRLVVANAIKNIVLKNEKVCFVVDHDLMFLDYVSDKILLFEGIPGEKGIAKKITTIEKAFNEFLKKEDITFRQDPDTKRPRANKKGSQKDQEQKRDNKYYYTL